MSDEQEDKIEETFIKKLGAKYPMAKIAASATQDYGIRFYPSIYCFAADGTVHSVPDDRMPSEAVIEQLLQDVSLVPELPDDREYDPVRQFWEDEDYPKLQAYLERKLADEGLAEEVRTVLTGQQEVLQKRAQAQLARVEKLAQGPDYYAAEQALERIEKAWKGFEAADKAKAELKRFAKDSGIKAEIKASKALAMLLDKHDGGSIVQQRKLAEALADFVKRFEGTHAAAQAKAQLERQD